MPTIIVSYTDFRTRLRECLRAGLMTWYDRDNINFNETLISDRSSEWIEVYLDGAEHVNDTLGMKVPRPDTVNMRAEVVCVSNNKEVEDAMNERDLMVSRAIKAFYDNKHDFDLSGAFVVGVAFDDRTDEHTTEGTIGIVWETKGD